MSRRSISILIAPLVLFAGLAGCVPVAPASVTQPTASAAVATAATTAETTPAPTPPATAAATASASAEAESFIQVPASCYVEGLPSYVDIALGLCFAYPQGFDLSSNDLGNVEVRGSAIGDSGEPLFALLTIESVPYQGQDLEPFVDEYLKANVAEGFPAKVERKRILMGGHGAEVLEPMPGRLSSRTVVVDNAPVSLFILTFWPSFRDTSSDQLNAESEQAQHDMDGLFEVVASSFATLPPPGIPIDPAHRVEVAKGCLVADRPLYISANNRSCFALPAQGGGDSRNADYGGVSFFYPAALAEGATGRSIAPQGAAALGGMCGRRTSKSR